MIEAVVFDIDQTLWDFHSLRRAGLAACLSLLRERYPDTTPSEWTIDDLQKRFDELEATSTGKRLASIRHQSLAAAAAEVARYDEKLPRELSEIYFKHRHGPSAPFPDAIPALDKLKQNGYRLAAMSNGNSRLDQIGLAGWWDRVLLGPEHGLAKPDPAIYSRLSTQLGCEPHQIVSVGDDPVNDVAGAQAAGWRGVWNRRTEAPLPIGIMPDAIVAKLTELPAIIANW